MNTIVATKQVKSSPNGLSAINSNKEPEENKNLYPVISNGSRLPPLYISNVTNQENLLSLFNKHIGLGTYAYKCYRNNQLRIMMDSIDNYHKMVNYLHQNKMVYQTCQLHKEKPFQIVIKNLHYTTDVELIEEELVSNGHIPRRIAKGFSRVTKKPLSMFFVDLEPNKNNTDVYKIILLCSSSVKIEPSVQVENLRQCYRCQEFGHKKSVCTNSYRCVKCAFNHRSRDCNKHKSEPPTCAHCGKAHPASYRGCAVYKQKLRKLKYDYLKKQENNNHLQSNDAKVKNANKTNQESEELVYLLDGFSYADITKGLHKKPIENKVEEEFKPYHWLNNYNKMFQEFDLLMINDFGSNIQNTSNYNITN